MEDVIRTGITLETARYAIRGEVSVPVGERLSDYANDEARDFFALTNAYLAPLDNPERERHVGFILVARHEIGVMMPGDVTEVPGYDAAAEHLYAFLAS